MSVSLIWVEPYATVAPEDKASIHNLSNLPINININNPDQLALKSFEYISDIKSSKNERPTQDNNNYQIICHDIFI